MSKHRLPCMGLLGVLVWLLGLWLLAHMWIKLGRDGAAADANATSGYISNGDLGLVGLGVALWATGGTAITWAAVRGRLRDRQ